MSSKKIGSTSKISSSSRNMNRYFIKDGTRSVSQIISKEQETELESLAEEIKIPKKLLMETLKGFGKLRQEPKDLKEEILGNKTIINPNHNIALISENLISDAIKKLRESYTNEILLPSEFSIKNFIQKRVLLGLIGKEFRYIKFPNNSIYSYELLQDIFKIINKAYPKIQDIKFIHSTRTEEDMPIIVQIEPEEGQKFEFFLAPEGREELEEERREEITTFDEVLQGSKLSKGQSQFYDKLAKVGITEANLKQYSQKIDIPENLLLSVLDAMEPYSDYSHIENRIDDWKEAKGIIDPTHASLFTTKNMGEKLRLVLGDNPKEIGLGGLNIKNLLNKSVLQLNIGYPFSTIQFPNNTFYSYDLIATGLKIIANTYPNLEDINIKFIFSNEKGTPLLMQIEDQEKKIFQYYIGSREVETEEKEEKLKKLSKEQRLKQLEAIPLWQFTATGTYTSADIKKLKEFKEVEKTHNIQKQFQSINHSLKRIKIPSTLSGISNLGNDMKRETINKLEDLLKLAGEYKGHIYLTGDLETAYSEIEKKLQEMFQTKEKPERIEIVLAEAKKTIPILKSAIRTLNDELAKQKLEYEEIKIQEHPILKKIAPIISTNEIKQKFPQLDWTEVGYFDYHFPKEFFIPKGTRDEFENVIQNIVQERNIPIN